MAERGALEKPWVRSQLIKLIATGEHTGAELAERFDVSESAISQFTRRHSERIATLASKLDDEFADLWAATKRNRIAVLQDQVEHAEHMLATADDLRLNVNTAEVMRTVQSAVRAIADELGQIPARQSVQIEGSLNVKVNGVDLEALR